MSPELAAVRALLAIAVALTLAQVCGAGARRLSMLRTRSPSLAEKGW